MARLIGESYERVYAAAETVKQQCLLSDGSLLFPGRQGREGPHFS